MNRNPALDYLRAAALFLMSLIHMWRLIVGWGGADAVVSFIGETAPCLFFVAFGMTQNVLVSKSNRQVASLLGILLLISFFHSYFLFQELRWTFFLFLSVSSVGFHQ